MPESKTIRYSSETPGDLAQLDSVISQLRSAAAHGAKWHCDIVRDDRTIALDIQLQRPEPAPTTEAATA